MYEFTVVKFGHGGVPNLALNLVTRVIFPPITTTKKQKRSTISTRTERESHWSMTKEFMNDYMQC